MLFRTTAVLRRAEEELYASGLDWWQSWRKRRGLRPSQVHIEHCDVPIILGQHIHMVSCHVSPEDKGARRETPLVCLHGFGHGTSTFYNSLAPLAEEWGGVVHALDMPGCGLSSRPKWSLPEPDQRCEAAESFFVDGLEAWRLAMGIDRMVIAGHSVGGICATAYACL